jgi:hypothetical protein
MSCTQANAVRRLTPFWCQVNFALIKLLTNSVIDIYCLSVLYSRPSSSLPSCKLIMSVSQHMQQETPEFLPSLKIDAWSPAPPKMALYKWWAHQVSSYAPSKAVALMYLLARNLLPVVSNTFHLQASLHMEQLTARGLSSVHQWWINLSISDQQELLLHHQNV